MNVLSLETSGKIISAALRFEEQTLELTIDRGFKHSETLMPAIASLLDQAGIKADRLDLVACSAGPGSFTALRIGMATAKGIARGADCPLKAVPTLALMAEGRQHWPGIVMPVMDARKKRVYAAAFRNGIRIAEDIDSSLELFIKALPENEPILATGADAEICADIEGIVIDPLHASGRAIALIDMALEAYRSDGPDPQDLGPIYLRLSEAEEALVKSE